MENKTHTHECGHTYWESPSSRWTCNRKAGHPGNHSRTSAFAPTRRWFNNSEPSYANYSHVVDEEVAAIKKQTTVLLTLEDLKTIAYYMAEEEDGDKTKIKIDEALKGML